MVWIVMTPDGEICFVCKTKEIALRHFKQREWRFDADENTVRIYYGRELRYNVSWWPIED